MSAKVSPFGASCLVLLCVAAISCSDDESGDPNCVDGDGACGASCSSSAPCESGLHCSSGQCVKECVSADLGQAPIDCANGGTCTGTGMCVGGGSGNGGNGGAGVDNPARRGRRSLGCRRMA